MDAAELAAALDEAAPAQAGEVAGDLRLRNAEQLDQLAHRALVFRQRFEDAKAGGVAEAAEVLRDDVGLDRLLREPERTYLGCCDLSSPRG